MLVKFFARGVGKGSGPVEYITRLDNPNTGTLREPAPEVIRGNPEITKRLIDGLDFKYKYNSGVLSFSIEDAPTEKEQQELIDSFEEYAFAGINHDSYNTLWVRHTHTGGERVELHFVTPKVELDTGKSLNIAPPGWHGYFKPWQTYWNIKQDWARPDDLSRKRIYSRGYQALIDASRQRAGLSAAPDPKKQLTEYITKRIEAGLVTNRDRIITSFTELGLEIPRIGKNYITVLNPEDNQRYRLKGGIYEASWRLGGQPEKEDRSPEQTPRTNSRSRTPTTETTTRDTKESDLIRLQERIRELAQTRASYHISRYGGEPPNLQKILGQTMDVAIGHSRESLSGYLRRELGADRIPINADYLQSNPTRPSQSGNKTTTADLEPSQSPNQRNQNSRNQQRDIHHPTPIQTTNPRLDVPGATLSQNGVVKEVRSKDKGQTQGQGDKGTRGHGDRENLEDKPSESPNFSVSQSPSLPVSPNHNQDLSDKNKSSIGVTDERTREPTEVVISTVSQGIQRTNRNSIQQILTGHEAVGEAEQAATASGERLERTSNELERTSQQIEQANRQIELHLRQVHRGLERGRRALERKRKEELEKFKIEINLVEYAQSQGYQYITSESSCNSAILRHPQGDKIVVATDTDGHGVYFSVRDDADNGTIIDFVQNRRNFSLGGVRKELRNWLFEPALQSFELTPVDKPQSVSRDRLSVIKAVSNFQVASEHPYLEQRGIKQSILESDRFLGTVAIDKRGNAIFPHHDQDGLTGYSVKNTNFTGFSRGGTKTLWQSNQKHGDLKLVITESAIDAMSYHQLFALENPNTRYISTGGTISNYQLELIESAMTEMAKLGGEIVIATDNDSMGNKMAKTIAKVAPEVSKIYRHVPQQSKDWNEVIERSRQRELIRQQQQERSRGMQL